MSAEASSTNHSIQIDQTDLIVCSGCICCMTTFYNKVPDCIGASGKSECCCISQELCCKFGASPLFCSGAEEGACCRLGCVCCAISLKSPTTCCKGQSHCCCIIGSCAFPTDEEIPCIVADSFLMCYPKCGCCVQLSAVKAPVASASTTKV